jgi:hypothetical protein
MSKAEDGLTHISLCFSTTTHLPVRAAIELPDLLRPTRRDLELVQYDQFQNVGGALLPQTISVTKPTQRHKSLTITSASWNPAVNDTTFGGVQ